MWLVLAYYVGGTWRLQVGANYNGTKFKYQLLSGTGWFSYKIWNKNSETPMVNLLKTLGHFEITSLKYNEKSIFWLFLNNDQNFLRIKISIEIWTFLFQIRVFEYFLFDHFPKSKIDSERRFEMRMSIFLFKNFFWSVSVNI